MATNTYVALDETTVGPAVPSITFTGISGAYTDLFVAMNIQGVAGAGSGANTVFVTFNGDTTSGLYSRTILLADVGGAQSSRTTGQNNINLGNAYESSTTANIYGTHLLNVQNYSNTTTFKTVLNRYSSNADRVGAVVGLWRNTDAITSLTITVDSSTGNIATGSTFSLYGIRAEGVSPAAKATGGAIYADSTYYYHVFGSSGTFTPLSSITADCLVVAGGGGGSSGAGGAGGVVYNAAQSLTATGYSITVGAGGAGGACNTTNGSAGADSVFNAFTAYKGGGGARVQQSATAGTYGSGGGGGQNGAGTTTGSTGTSGQGFDGTGNAGYTGIPYPGGSGGGAGANGNPPTGNSTLGTGGVGLSTWSSWGLATGIGQNVSGTYYIAGGGGAAFNNSTPGSAGGFGGGGAGGGLSTNGTNGTVASGGGGGGSGQDGTGGAGGSGIVIVRYLKA